MGKGILGQILPDDQIAAKRKGGLSLECRKALSDIGGVFFNYQNVVENWIYSDNENHVKGVTSLISPVADYSITGSYSGPPKPPQTN